MVQLAGSSAPCTYCHVTANVLSPESVHGHDSFFLVVVLRIATSWSVCVRKEEETAVTLAGRVEAPPDRREAALRRLVEGLQEFGSNGPLLMDGTRKRHREEGL